MSIIAMTCRLCNTNLSWDSRYYKPDIFEATYEKVEG